MLKSSKYILGIGLLIISSYASAVCDSLFPLGKPIIVDNTITLCNKYYVVVWDTTINGPILSSAPYKAHTTVPRSNAFKSDTRLPHYATNGDYLNTGYDRGHLTPSDDAYNKAFEKSTFLLSNMTPQSKILNESKWRILETKVRLMKPDYILTGAYYLSNPNTIGVHHIPVPTGYYKVVWVGKTMYAWYADNSNTAVVVPISIPVLSLKTKITYPLP